jgi:hypothetical protein
MNVLCFASFLRLAVFEKRNGWTDGRLSITYIDILSASHVNLITMRFDMEVSIFTLNTEADCSSETSIDSQKSIRRYIPEDSNLHDHRCENLKSGNNNN